MMEESSNISFSGGDALVYSAEPIHKKYYKTFVWGHPFMTNFLALVRPCMHLE